MDKIFNVLSIVIGIAGGIAAKIFGAWCYALWALIVLMILDYITGVIKAIYNKNVSSEIGYKGILKKITILVIVALANIIQELLGDNVAIREIVIMFFIANEGISILENAAVLLPNVADKLKLKDILLQLRDSNSRKDKDDENN